METEYAIRIATQLERIADTLVEQGERQKRTADALERIADALAREEEQVERLIGEPLPTEGGDSA